MSDAAASAGGCADPAARAANFRLAGVFSHQNIPDRFTLKE
jgi:hypothetical protein